MRRFVLRVPYRLDTVNHRLIHAGPFLPTHGFRYPTKGYTCLESGCSHYPTKYFPTHRFEHLANIRLGQ